MLTHLNLGPQGRYWEVMEPFGGGAYCVISRVIEHVPKVIMGPWPLLYHICFLDHEVSSLLYYGYPSFTI